MPSFHKNNFFPFIAVIIALMLCMPILSLKPPQPKKAVISSQVDKPDETESQLIKAGLVDVTSMNAGFAFDIRYGTDNNFTGKKIYNSQRCFLRPETASKLALANKEFMSMGYKIKIWDAYRPYSVQFYLYSKVSNAQKGIYIANPYTNGSNHNRGAAIDITLVYLNGAPVSMPTDLDNFTYAAYIYNNGCTKEQKQNRDMLASVMVKYGFSRCTSEWWHFDDTNAQKYTILNIAI